jgi:hypothetical protein
VRLGTLKRGEWRLLAPTEIEALKRGRPPVPRNPADAAASRDDARSEGRPRHGRPPRAAPREPRRFEPRQGGGRRDRNRRPPHAAGRPRGRN